MNIRTTSAVALVVGLCASLAIAAPVTFQIDPTQSSLTLSATVDFPPIGLLPSTPQGAFFPTHIGTSLGDSSSYSGTIKADVSNTIQFTGGSLIDASVTSNALGWAPTTGGGPPGQTLPTLTFVPADYGFSFAGLVFASVENITFDLSSAVIPIVGGNFAGPQSMPVNGGSLNYTDIAGGTILSPGSSSLIGLPLSNPVGGSVAAVGPLLKLTLPVNISQGVVIDGTPVTLLISGQLVALQSVPEPSTWLMLGLGVLGIAPFVRRKMR